MKKIICLLLSLTLLSGCTFNETESNEIEDITITIKENTLTNTSMTLIIENHSDQDYSFDNYFTIDKKENDKWQECDIISSLCPSTLPIYYSDKDSSMEMEQDWSCLYGDLSGGDYRLVKSVTCGEDVYKFFVEFTLN